MYYHESERRKSVYFWIAILVIFVVILNLPAVKRSKPLHAARSIAAAVSYPVKYVFNGIYSNTTSFFGNIYSLRNAEKENVKLSAELKEYKSRSVLLSDLSAENEKLRMALSFRARSFVPRLLPAEITGRSGSSWFNVVEINKGSDDNVSHDSAVLNEEGLVGRVFDVSKNSSKVLLITDPSSAISAVDSTTGDMGIAAGNSIGPLKVQYMSATAAIKEGDKIITSGMSDIFPKGIVIGTVRSVSKKDYDIFQKVDVNAAVNFSKLDKVFVVAK
jgi:rod shape-determining protein MreC